MASLPKDGRLYREVSDENKMSPNDHLMFRIIDLLTEISYYTRVEAGKNVKSAQWSKVVGNAPEPISPMARKHLQEQKKSRQLTFTSKNAKHAQTAVRRAINHQMAAIKAGQA